MSKIFPFFLWCIGGIFHYFLVNTVLWWFSHVSVLFYKLMAPTTAKRTKKYEKYIHVVIVCVGQCI